MIIKGEVVKGKQRGKSLGFPTANITLTQKIPEGIYISKTNFNGKIYPSITFVGEAKTFNETIFQAEIYLFDEQIDLYGKLIEVELLEKIRDNQKFKSSKDLIKAMETDEKKAREYFNR